jgi:CP family cyanate transporter-like MFS transporter
VTKGRAGLLAALFLSALALRPQIVGVSPLLSEIQDDLSISHAVAGLLGTIPVLCMGLFAPPAPLLGRRLGSRNAVALCLGLIAAFGVARAVVPSAALVILLTIGVGVGIGFAGALVPVFVKERFSDRPAFATGLYATGVNVGSAVTSALAVPIAHAVWGWRASLVAFSVATALIAVLWLLQTRGGPRYRRGVESLPRLPLSSGVAWFLVVPFGLLGIAYYGLNAWLPDSYVERGWSESSAGALLSAYHLFAVPGSLVISWLADHVGSRRAWFAASVLLMLGGVVAIVVAPGGAWVWVSAIGLANGALFALLMTLPLDVADRPSQVGAVAGLMLGAGYCIAATAPFVLGAVRDVTGSFTASLWLVVGVCAAVLVASLFLTSERLGRGVRPAGARAVHPETG